MKLTIRQLALATALVVITASASLAFGPGMGYGPGGMMGGPGMMQRGFGPGFALGDNPAQRLDELKTRLGITAQQEPAWTAYRDALLGHYAAAKSMHDARWSGAGAFPTVDQRQAMFATRTALWNATQSLNQVLTDAQKSSTGGLIGPSCPRTGLAPGAW